MAITASLAAAPLDDHVYRRRIRAWVLYDWANSAFATTVLAVVLPIYYSQVAGATLPSEAVATQYWSLILSFTLLVSAVLSPILGTVADIIRGKKRFLALFTALGAVFTGLLVLVDVGDWILASVIFVVARVAFIAAITFYDSLLPHVARPDDRDRVSAQGFAVGYLGGGILLALNVVMIQVLPGTWGPRLAFVSVALWWAIFAIPLLRTVPEPPAASRVTPGLSLIGETFRRLAATLRDVRRYRELFKFLVAFLIYNDAIGTVIGLAAIYGAELGLGTVELVLALLLVQFAGIPFSLLFGRLASPAQRNRGFLLAFVVFNMVALPVAGIGARVLLPAHVTGVVPPAALAAGPAARESSLGVILGLLAAVQLLGLLFARLAGPRWFARLAHTLDTRRALFLALLVYSIVVGWAFFLDSNLEFWFLAWMNSIVQGGSQALSRSLFASLSPASKSGEFFGLYAVMEKFSAIAGPLLFALAVGLFGSSRPAVLTLLLFLVVGGFLLSRVDVALGQRLARDEDAALVAAGVVE